MKIEDKYQILSTQYRFIFLPNLPSQRLSVIVLAIISAIMIFLFIWFETFSQGWVLTIVILGGYTIIHSIYDIFYRAKTKIIIDKEANMVLRETTFKKKEICECCNSVVFVKKNMGSWHYAIGHKKKYLYQNYRISEDFYNLRKESKSQAEYEKKILKPVIELLNSCQM